MSPEPPYGGHAGGPDPPEPPPISVPPPGPPPPPPSPGWGAAPAGGVPGVTPVAPRHHPFSRVSGLAVTALALALSGLVFVVVAPLVALVLAGIAAVRVRRSGGMLRGARVVLAARLVAGAVLVLNLLTITLVLANWSRIVDAVEAVGSVTDVSELEDGECVVAGSEGPEQWQRVRRVPCDQPHDAEVGALLVLTETAYPGLDRLLDTTEARCATALEAYLGEEPVAGAEDAGVLTLVPTPLSWSLGDREGICLLTADLEGRT